MSANETVCTLDTQQQNLFWLTVVTVILNFLLQVLAGVVPNFNNILDVFRHHEAKKGDTAQIKRSIAQVVSTVANLTPQSLSARSATP